jgi:two-component system LytT family response regulator
MENTNDFIIVTDNGMKHLLPLEDILHVEAVRIYSIFYLRSSARQYVSSSNLGKVYRELGNKNFIRIHKSHIINLNEIKAYQQGRGGKVVLSDNTMISVGQRRKTELLRHLYQLNKKVKYGKQQIINISPRPARSQR